MSNLSNAICWNSIDRKVVSVAEIEKKNTKSLMIFNFL